MEIRPYNLFNKWSLEKTMTHIIDQTNKNFNKEATGAERAIEDSIRNSSPDSAPTTRINLHNSIVDVGKRGKFGQNSGFEEAAGIEKWGVNPFLYPNLSEIKQIDLGQ